MKFRRPRFPNSEPGSFDQTPPDEVGQIADRALAPRQPIDDLEPGLVREHLEHPRLLAKDVFALAGQKNLRYDLASIWRLGHIINRISRAELKRFRV
jgi:hypothetical protein